MIGAVNGLSGSLVLLGLGGLVAGIAMVAGASIAGRSGRVPGAIVALIGLTVGMLGARVPSGGDRADDATGAPEAISETAATDEATSGPTDVPDSQESDANDPSDSDAAAAGTYSGTFIVTADRNNIFDDTGDSVDRTGETFERSLQLDLSCDAGDGPCGAGGDSLRIDFDGDEPFEITWTAQTDEGWFGWSEYEAVSDCVAESGVVVGEFDTTITYDIELSEPVMRDGELVWSVLEVSYLENAISNDTEQGCYTSAYAAQGLLEREP